MPKDKIPLVADDPWLEPHEAAIEERIRLCMDRISTIAESSGSLRQFSMAYRRFGIHRDEERGGWRYREWAPGASGLSLIGDFNDWDREDLPMSRGEDGVWELFVEDGRYEGLGHESRVKVHVRSQDGGHDRIPAWINRAVQDEDSPDFSGQIWHPETPFDWTDRDYDPGSIRAPLIYEAHPGMAQEREGVGTWREFAENILPRVAELGYNCIQLMAVQEHPYYGSFGYHVSNFFAPASRFGTPEDLKYLINKAHGQGIAVIMDVVHSHAVKNIAEGLNAFDGTDDQYFHPGGRGYHEGWDSKLFNYGKREVQQFLLSNLHYWLEEFHFDGFRFDGVTSMLYFHHGNISFDSYDKYFGDGVEWDAITYLQMANELIHEVKPGCLSIAEDMSGMPGTCRKVWEGGLGFDYRLGMGIPDYWIKLLKHSKDEEWNFDELWHTLNNRRWKEKTIAYAESHDQALVGDKSLAFWLMDQEMYWNMHIQHESLVIDRGIALHKMIRLLTISLGGEGYLNFIGNEFGHPEWVDFPREGNGWSYFHARRQWSLVDDHNLRYRFLNNFDRAMVHFAGASDLLASLPAQQLHMDGAQMVMIFERNNFIFVFNLHPERSFEDYEFGIPAAGAYRVVLNSDRSEYGGFDRQDESQTHHSLEDAEGNAKLRLYLPSRSAMVLEGIES